MWCLSTMAVEAKCSNLGHLKFPPPWLSGWKVSRGTDASTRRTCCCFPPVTDEPAFLNAAPVRTVISLFTYLKHITFYNCVVCKLFSTAGQRLLQTVTSPFKATQRKRSRGWAGETLKIFHQHKSITLSGRSSLFSCLCVCASVQVTMRLEAFIFPW